MSRLRCSESEHPQPVADFVDMTEITLNINRLRGRLKSKLFARTCMRIAGIKEQFTQEGGGEW
eukprot:4155285-Amphidinium_carterae.1